MVLVSCTPGSNFDWLLLGQVGHLPGRRVKNRHLGMSNEKDQEKKEGGETRMGCASDQGTQKRAGEDGIKRLSNLARVPLASPRRLAAVALGFFIGPGRAQIHSLAA